MIPRADLYDFYPAFPAYLNWTQRQKRYLRLRDGDNCWICGKVMDFYCDTNKPNAATIEHVVPRSRGGVHARNNLTLSHKKCNCERGRIDGQKQKEENTK